ncbi:hypothetical protein MMC34_005072 [Xylographa carneopallida]|nr:hypothetical protein [Xylographa carneopallida]
MLIDGDTNSIRETAAIIPGQESELSNNLCHIRQISLNSYTDDSIPKSHVVFTGDTVIDHVHLNTIATDRQTGWLLFDAGGRPIMTGGFEQEAGRVQNLCTERVVKRDAVENMKVWSSKDQSLWSWSSAETIVAATRIETEVWATTQQFSSETQIVENLVAVAHGSGVSSMPTLTKSPFLSTERIDDTNMIGTDFVLPTYPISYETSELLTSSVTRSLVTVATSVAVPLIISSASKPPELSVLAAFTSGAVPVISTTLTSDELALSFSDLTTPQPQLTTLITSDRRTGISNGRESTTEAAEFPSLLRISDVFTGKMVTALMTGSSYSTVSITTIFEDEPTKSIATFTDSTKIASANSMSSQGMLDVSRASAAAFTSLRSADSFKTSKSFSTKLSTSLESVVFETPPTSATSSSMISDSDRSPSSSLTHEATSYFTVATHSARETRSSLKIPNALTFSSIASTSMSVEAFTAMGLFPGTCSETSSDVPETAAPSLKGFIETKASVHGHSSAALTTIFLSSESETTPIFTVPTIPGISSNQIPGMLNRSLLTTSEEATSTHFISDTIFPHSIIATYNQKSLSTGPVFGISEASPGKLTREVLNIAVMTFKEYTTSEGASIPSSAPMISKTLNSSSSNLNIESTSGTAIGQFKAGFKDSLTCSHISKNRATRSMQYNISITASGARSTASSVNFISINSTLPPTTTSSQLPGAVPVIGPSASVLPSLQQTDETVPTVQEQKHRSMVKPKWSTISSVSEPIQYNPLQILSSEEAWPSQEVVAACGIPSATSTISNDTKSMLAGPSSTYSSDVTTTSLSTSRYTATAPPPTSKGNKTTTLSDLAPVTVLLDKTSAAVVACTTSRSSKASYSSIRTSVRWTQILSSIAGRPTTGSSSFSNVTSSTSYLPQITAQRPTTISNEQDLERLSPKVVSLFAAPALEVTTLSGSTPPAGNTLPSSPPLGGYPSPRLPTLDTTVSDKDLDTTISSSSPSSIEKFPLPEHISVPESPCPQSLSSPALLYPEDVPLSEDVPLPEDVSLPEDISPPQSPPELIPLPESPLPKLAEADQLPESFRADHPSLPPWPAPELLPLPQSPIDTTSVGYTPDIINPYPAGQTPKEIFPQPPPPNSPEAANPTLASPTPPQPPFNLKGTTTFNPLTGEPIRLPNNTSPFLSPCPKPKLNPLPSLKPVTPNAPYRDPSAGKFDTPPLKPVPKAGGSDRGGAGTGAGNGDGEGRSWKAVNSSHFDPWTGEHVGWEDWERGWGQWGTGIGRWAGRDTSREVIQTCVADAEKRV